MTATPRTVLVLGGTGKTGRRVAAGLARRGVPVRLGSRGGRPPFDWADRGTWPAAVAGVGAVYLCHAPDLAVPGADDDVAELTRLAVAAGARRVVLLSGRGEPEAQEAERRVRAVAEAAGAEWAVVRAAWFVQNLTEGAFRDAVADGVLALPVGEVAEPFVDADDVAAVAVAVLTGDVAAGRVYDVTGPRSLTFADLAAEVTAAGRTLRFASVPAAEWTAQLRAAGVPADEADLLAYLFTTVLDGRNSAAADGVAAALGRPATDVRVALVRAAAAGAWDPAEVAG